MKDQDETLAYIQCLLSDHPILSEYIQQGASILVNSYEDGLVWDGIVLLENGMYKFEFAHLFGDSFVIDEHLEHRDIFIKVKSYEWLLKDLANRLPISLWILEHTFVVRDFENRIAEIVSDHHTIFDQKLADLIATRYLGLRSERHNLRFSAKRVGDLGSDLTKAAMIKLSMEISLLAERKTFPFKVLLPGHAEKNTAQGKFLSQLYAKFFSAKYEHEVIALSEEIIQQALSTLSEKKFFSDDFLNNWWLYL